MPLLTLWDVENGKEIRTFTGHHGAVYSVVFAPNGRTALSGGSDGTLKLWDLGGLSEWSAKSDVRSSQVEQHR